MASDSASHKERLAAATAIAELHERRVTMVTAALNATAGSLPSPRHSAPSSDATTEGEGSPLSTALQRVQNKSAQYAVSLTESERDRAELLDVINRLRQDAERQDARSAELLERMGTISDAAEQRRLRDVTQVQAEATAEKDRCRQLDERLTKATAGLALAQDAIREAAAAHEGRVMELASTIASMREREQAATETVPALRAQSMAALEDRESILSLTHDAIASAAETTSLVDARVTEIHRFVAQIAAAVSEERRQFGVLDDGITAALREREEALQAMQAYGLKMETDRNLRAAESANLKREIGEMHRRHEVAVARCEALQHALDNAEEAAQNQAQQRVQQLVRHLEKQESELSALRQRAYLHEAAAASEHHRREDVSRRAVGREPQAISPGAPVERFVSSAQPIDASSLPASIAAILA